MPEECGENRQILMLNQRNAGLSSAQHATWGIKNILLITIKIVFYFIEP